MESFSSAHGFPIFPRVGQPRLPGRVVLPCGAAAAPRTVLPHGAAAAHVDAVRSPRERDFLKSRSLIFRFLTFGLRIFVRGNPQETAGTPPIGNDTKIQEIKFKKSENPCPPCVGPLEPNARAIEGPLLQSEFRRAPIGGFPRPCLPISGLTEAMFGDAALPEAHVALSKPFRGHACPP